MLGGGGVAGRDNGLSVVFVLPPHSNSQSDWERFQAFVQDWCGADVWITP